MLAERALGIDSTGQRELFPTFTELSSRVPARVWQAMLVASIAAYLAVIGLMFVRPGAGLFVFFHMIVPLWPAFFLIAPGLWRSICPLAASNQAPRILGFSRGLTAPNWLRNRGYLIAVTLFFGITGARLAGLDRNGAAMGGVLAAVVTVAFAGGHVFKDKSLSRRLASDPLRRATADFSSRGWSGGLFSFAPSQLRELPFRAPRSAFRP